MAECSACGQCCEVIPLPVSQLEVSLKPPWAIDERTRRWIVDELERISPKEARRLAPWRDGSELQLGPEGWIADYPIFYRCKNLDPVTRLCTSHEDLPPTCSQFPYYGQPTINPGINLPPRCAYREELGQTVEEWDWQPVTLRRSHG